MTVRPPTLAPLALVLVLATTLSAAPDESAPPDSTAVPRLPEPQEQLDAATPRVRELLTAWEAHELELAALGARLAATKDRGGSIALEDQIERLKFAMDLEMLRIQAEHARHAGQVEVAEELDGAIARLSAQRLQLESRADVHAIEVELLPAAGEQQ